MLSTAYRRHSYNLYFDLCDNLVTHEETVSQGDNWKPNICCLENFLNLITYSLYCHS